MEKDDGQVGACVCTDTHMYAYKENKFPPSKQGHGYSLSLDCNLSSWQDN